MAWRAPWSVPQTIVLASATYGVAALIASKLSAVPLETWSGRSFFRLCLWTFQVGTPWSKTPPESAQASQPRQIPGHIGVGSGFHSTSAIAEGVPGLLREKTRPARIPPLGTEVEARVVAAIQTAAPGEDAPTCVGLRR